MEEPLLQPIAHGRWAARRGGYAVHGATKEEALKHLYEAEEDRRHSALLPPWRDRMRETITGDNTAEDYDNK